MGIMRENDCAVKNALDRYLLLGSTIRMKSDLASFAFGASVSTFIFIRESFNERSSMSKSRYPEVSDSPSFTYGWG